MTDASFIYGYIGNADHFTHVNICIYSQEDVLPYYKAYHCLGAMLEDSQYKVHYATCMATWEVVSWMVYVKYSIDITDSFLTA